jgi:uncharacterized membrane protein (DUF441 family)
MNNLKNAYNQVMNRAILYPLKIDAIEPFKSKLYLSIFILALTIHIIMPIFYGHIKCFQAILLSRIINWYLISKVN